MTGEPCGLCGRTDYHVHGRGLHPMTGENRPWSERVYEKHCDWVDKDNAARMLEETKSLVFAQKCAALGDMPVNRAEQTIKASSDWYDHVVKVVEAKTVANQAKAELELVRTKKEEFFNEEANHRAEARL